MELILASKKLLYIVFPSYICKPFIIHKQYCFVQSFSLQHMYINIAENYGANHIFQVSAEYAPVGIIELDALGYCRYVNQRWVELTGMEEDEIRINAWHKTIHPDDKNKVLTRWSDDAELQIEFDMEFRFLLPNGEINWVECRAISFVNDELQTVGYIATIVDISERVQLQQELLANNNTLSQFRYIISHDLRGPVRNIIGLLSFYNKEDALDRNNPEIIDKLEQSATKLQQILKDLIEVSDVTNPSSATMTDVKFSHVVDFVKNSIEDVIINTNTQIFTDFEEVPSILFTRVHLQSIILNLVSNAIKYKSPDRNPIIKIRTYKKGRFTFMEVTDNGIGINMVRNKDKIFGLFQRFHSNADGKGLGLYIIKSIVESHGGKISVESEVNIGTTFTVSFKNR